MSIVSKIKAFSAKFLGGAEIAIDLGTSMTRIGIYEKGIVLREPTYIGLNTKTNEYLFFGQEAKEIYGKAPHFIHVIQPMKNGVIADFDAHVLLIEHFLQKSVFPFFLSKSFIKSKLIGYSVVPASSTEVEQKAIQESLVKAGLSEVFLIEKPLATASGAHSSLFSHLPLFIIDMGGGLIEMAIMIMGGIVAYKSIKNAGKTMDQQIINYIHLKYGVHIGEQTAEHIKINLLSLTNEQKTATIRGKSLENGLPKSIRVTSNDIKEALANNLNQIIDTAKELVETVQPEIIDGIVKSGIIITGDLAHIPGIDSFISADLKIPVVISENPQVATINGILKLIGSQEHLQKVLIK